MSPRIHEIQVNWLRRMEAHRRPLNWKAGAARGNDVAERPGSMHVDVTGGRSRRNPPPSLKRPRTLPGLSFPPSCPSSPQTTSPNPFRRLLRRARFQKTPSSIFFKRKYRQRRRPSNHFTFSIEPGEVRRLPSAPTAPAKPPPSKCSPGPHPPPPPETHLRRRPTSLFRRQKRFPQKNHHGHGQTSSNSSWDLPRPRILPRINGANLQHLPTGPTSNPAPPNSPPCSPSPDKPTHPTRPQTLPRRAHEMRKSSPHSSTTPKSSSSTNPPSASYVNAQTKRPATSSATHNQKYNATILLTSHYMADITCPLQTRPSSSTRAGLFYDGPLAAIIDRFAPPLPRSENSISPTSSPAESLTPFGEIQSHEGRLRQPHHPPRTPELKTTARILSSLPSRGNPDDF